MGHDGSSGSAILAAQWAMHDDPPSRLSFKGASGILWTNLGSHCGVAILHF